MGRGIVPGSNLATEAATLPIISELVNCPEPWSYVDVFLDKSSSSHGTQECCITHHLRLLDPFQDTDSLCQLDVTS